ncbi:MAG: hypothetical protein V7L01_28710 [Nostoc sp.]|uniref:hypothetical protein n=1 Tax=Nostoc sp. TaxID=1180 RepID=UPI002FFB568E
MLVGIYKTGQSYLYLFALILRLAAWVLALKTTLRDKGAGGKVLNPLPFANGDIILTSSAPITPHSSWQKTADCPALNQHQGG